VSTNREVTVANATIAGQGRVLVLARDTGLGEGLRSELERAGLEVELVDDVEEGHQRAGTGGYTAYAVDVSLPDGDGYRFVAGLRAAGHDQPVLLLGAPHGHEDMLSVQRGWPDWEPVVRQGLHDVPRALRALIRHEQIDAARRLRYGGISLDRLERRMCVDGAEVRITPVEWGILEHLLLNAEHTVTRETLIAVVWGPDSDLQSNALDVHIGHLRRKLECAGLDGVIETIRGRGYMLRVSDAADPEGARATTPHPNWSSTP
jgi:DNA-binding response OmpR family regulator